jgi:HEAT repeat protein
VTKAINGGQHVITSGNWRRAISASAALLMTFPIEAQNRALGPLLAEISRKGVPIAVHQNIAAQAVSTALDNVCLDDGLRQILKNSDAIYFYREDELGHTSLKAVWIYAKGTADNIELAFAQTSLSKRDLESKLNEQDSAVRGRTAATLIERKDESAQTILVSALSDPEDSVRAQALSKAIAIGMDIPPDKLWQLAETDASTMDSSSGS